MCCGTSRALLQPICGIDETLEPLRCLTNISGLLTCCGGTCSVVFCALLRDCFLPVGICDGECQATLAGGPINAGRSSYWNGRGLKFCSKFYEWIATRFRSADIPVCRIAGFPASRAWLV